MIKKMWYAILFCILITGTANCKDEAQGDAGDAVVPHHEIVGATYVGIETCAMCHEKIAKNFKRSEHARIVVSSKQEGQACETCHGPGSLHADAEGMANKKATIINPKKNPDACYQCHLDKKAAFSLQYHHPVNEGKMGCNDCHDPHGDDAIKPNTIASLSVKNTVCAKCHKEQTGRFVYEHEALRDGCTVCHDVHGSINDKMLIERDSNLCLKCHYQEGLIRGGATGGMIGDFSHSTRIPQGPCFSGGCHTAVHGSNYNDHVRL